MREMNTIKIGGQTYRVEDVEKCLANIKPV